jgi:hypothetical protein
VSPAKLPTRPADRAWAGGRCRVGEKYLEVAGVASAEDWRGHQRLCRVELGNRLRALVALKPGSHYGNALLTTAQRDAAVRASEALIEEARKRTS